MWLRLYFPREGKEKGMAKEGYESQFATDVQRRGQSNNLHNQCESYFLVYQNER